MGKYVIKPTKNGGFRFNLKAGNGEIIGTSETYTTLKTCENGIASVTKNAPAAAIEDQTVEGGDLLQFGRRSVGNGTGLEGSRRGLSVIDQFAAVNGLSVNPYDFEAYPIIGMAMDEFDLFLLNGEWRDFRWLRYNEAGVPVLGVNCIETLSHTLYPGHAQVAYEFMRHFSRDLDTGLSIYTPD